MSSCLSLTSGSQYSLHLGVEQRNLGVAKSSEGESKEIPFGIEWEKLGG